MSRLSPQLLIVTCNSLVAAFERTWPSSIIAGTGRTSTSGAGRRHGRCPRGSMSARSGCSVRRPVCYATIRRRETSLHYASHRNAFVHAGVVSAVLGAFRTSRLN